MSEILRTSLLKYPGGKTRELKNLLPFFPSDSDRFIDPFVGGGSVWIGSNYSKNAINDFSKDLINLYKHSTDKELLSLLNDFDEDLEHLVFNSETLNKLKETDDLYAMNNIVSNFASSIDLKFLNIKDQFEAEYPKYIKRKINYLNKKGIKSKEDTIDLLQTSLNASYYNAVRFLYNTVSDNELVQTSLYLFIREFCYSSMFRFGKNGFFNVPYGGKSYNNKRFQNHIGFYTSEFFNKKKEITDIYNLDFQEFLEKIEPNNNDFIFLDPPYDSDFSTYDNNSFDKSEQERLANYIKSLNSKWLLVIKDTDLIRSLYPEDKFNYFDYKKRYAVNFMNRNKQKVNHLVITNF